MTLALYGKSRKRQGSLMLAALLSILAATVAGVALVSTAFAHHNTYTASRACGDVWSSTATYVGGGDLRMIVVSDVVINGAPFDSSWESDIPGSFATAGFPAASAFAAGEAPTGTVKWFWSGTDGGGTIFARNTASNGAFNATWGGSITLYRQVSGLWTKSGASGEGANPITITTPAAPTNCDATIIVRKWVPDGINGTATPFNVSVSDNGTPKTTNQPFSEEPNPGGSPGEFTGTYPVEGNDSGGDNDDFTVTESASPGFTTSWYVTATNVTCSDISDGNYSAGSVASGSELSNLDPGAVRYVCFRNVPLPTVSVAKTHAGDGTYNLNEAFSYTVTFTVAGAATTSSQSWNDDLPAHLDYIGLGTQVDPGSDLACAGNTGTDDVVCTLDSGAPVGVYSQVINVQVKATAACTPAVNNVRTGATAGQGTIAATDTVNIAGCALPSVSVTKVDSGDGTYGPNEAFYWTLSWTVTNPPTTTSLQYTDVLNSNLNFVSLSDEVDPDSELSCSQAAGTVSCQLESGAGVAPGPTVYSIRVNVTVKATPTCGTVTNTVNNVAGAPVATDNVEIVNCVLPSVTVTKDAPQASYNIGQSFNWTITATVANGPTVAPYAMYDDIPAGFTLNSVTPSAGITCSSGNNDPVICTLGVGSGSGPHALTINVTVNAAATCGPVTNTVINGTAAAAGQPVASDEVTIAGCGEVTMEKSDTTQLVDAGANIQWDIALHNSSAVAKVAKISDAGATLVGPAACAQAGGAGTVITCTVPASNGNLFLPELIVQVKTAVPVQTGTQMCSPQVVTNTAYLLDPNNTSGQPVIGVDPSDSGTYTIPATAHVNCLTVTKVNSGNGTWTITFGNIGPTAEVDMSDTYEPNGTSTQIINTTQSGCTQSALTLEDCEVTLLPGGKPVTVTTTPLVAQCESQTVDNIVTATFNGSTITGSGTEASFTLPGNSELCDKTIVIVKNYVQLNGYAPVPGDLPAFVLNPPVPNVPGSACTTQDNGEQVILTCTVPADWVGTVTETPAAGWEQTQCVFEVTLVQELGNLVRSIFAQAIPVFGDFNFCNRPLGEIEVIKQDNVAAANPSLPGDNDWDFTVTGPNAYSESGTTAVGVNPGSFVLTGVPLGNGYDASEIEAQFGQCPTDSNPNGVGFETTIIAGGPLNITAPGQRITFIFENEDCGAVLGTGQLQVFKVRDLNGNGSTDGADTNIVWSVTITGPQFPGGQQFDVPATGLFLDGLDEGVYTIQESLGAGYSVVGVSTIDDAATFVGGATSTSVNLTNNDIDTVTFFNQPLREIRVQKVAYTRHGNGADVLAPSHDDGWIITVSSAQCQFTDSEPTDANGVAVFTNLPLCNDYVVSENPVNASSPGFTPGGPIQHNNVTPGLPGDPLVVTFVNRLQTFDPPCVICNTTTPTVTATPTTPTTTATPPTNTPTNTPVPSTNTPTNTPADPSASPSVPVTNIAGERTPGPGQTPIAPSAGSGPLGGAGGGLNLLLILGGLIALSSGLGFVALGRKRG